MNGPAVPLADVEDRDDVRVPGQPRGGERLPREALADGLVERVALGEHLHATARPSAVSVAR